MPPDLTSWRDFDALLIALEQSCRRLHARYVRDRTGLLAVCQRLSVRSSTLLRRAAMRRAG
jgi:hypothetical protein